MDSALYRFVTYFFTRLPCLQRGYVRWNFGMMKKLAIRAWQAPP